MPIKFYYFHGSSSVNAPKAKQESKKYSNPDMPKTINF
jgi:hypothetical protein